MKQNSKTVRFSGEYSSPGRAENCDSGGGMPTSWSSERAANPNARRHVGGAALMPFNSLRALPSKWDDAERWITSPVSSYGGSVQIPRRPKSKSGPLGLTTGVLLLPHVENPDGSAKEESPISDGVNHRDMGTQITPDERLSFSTLPSLGHASLHQNDVSASKDEVRDVQVDKGITTAGQSKKQEMIQKRHQSCKERQQKSLLGRTCRRRGELEIKLEKKKSASMDKIMNKLRASEMEAQAMRNLLSEKDTPQTRTSWSHGEFRVSKYNCFLCRRN
ncbi:hypothetical protein AAHA92_03250 [Salvia divinorum]|uniref:Remorin C-terminal domain-containing protein n=1 Tax=Salvia divinorum TaxID=28513 RepID=A0ABD1IHA6_SALDI